MSFFDFADKKRRLQKWLPKAPTHLFRARLGFLFGYRLLMIEHRGRKSGVMHRTVLEVGGRRADEWICTSGSGPRADWYLNLKANGVEAVWLGSKRHTASVRFLEPEEAAGFMADYEQDHPKLTPKLFDNMGVSYDGTHEDRIRMMGAIPMVAFKLTS